MYPGRRSLGLGGREFSWGSYTHTHYDRDLDPDPDPDPVLNGPQGPQVRQDRWADSGTVVREGTTGHPHWSSP